MAEAENKSVVAGLWQALYRKDWDGVAAHIGERGHYEDVPTPDRGAIGPVNVVKRLKSGLEVVERFEHGEKLVNHFVTIHEVRDGKVQLWRDYWDLNTLMSQAPAWWIERLAKHDASEWQAP